jgi:hypothetical protein
MDQKAKQEQAERNNLVKKLFETARTDYVQGNYTLCLQKVKKIHARMESYENSKELQAFCEQGLALLERRKLNESAKNKARVPSSRDQQAR